MCHKEAKYFLCGHRASLNTMYCRCAMTTGNVCRNPQLAPSPSPPVNSPCESCQVKYNMSRRPHNQNPSVYSKAAS